MKMSLSHILEVNGQGRHFICCAIKILNFK